MVEPSRLTGAMVGLVAKLTDHTIVDLDCRDGTSVRLVVTEVLEVGRTVGAVQSEREQPKVTCPRCGASSYHPADIAAGYCWRCRDWTARV